MLGACSERRDSFLDPAGPVAAAQRAHLIEVVAWTMIAIVPVFVGVPLLLWRYRYRNDKARYTPDWAFSGWLDVAMWGVPFVIIVVLGAQLWRSAHALDPYKPIAPAGRALNVQVIGLDWKWLFVYPDLGIASMNELAFPTDTSVALDLTTDTVMQSFMIAALAGQVYAMPGMRTKLHVLADAPGTFEGENTQFNGDGFAQQKFDAVAMAPEGFDAWVAGVREVGVPLDAAAYGKLAAASTGDESYATFGTEAMPDRVVWFDTVPQDLFDSILGRYRTDKPVRPEAQPGSTVYLPSAVLPPPASGMAMPHSAMSGMRTTEGVSTR